MYIYLENILFTRKKLLSRFFFSRHTDLVSLKSITFSKFLASTYIDLKDEETFSECMYFIGVFVHLVGVSFYYKFLINLQKKDLNLFCVYFLFVFYKFNIFRFLDLIQFTYMMDSEFLRNFKEVKGKIPVICNSSLCKDNKIMDCFAKFFVLAEISLEMFYIIRLNLRNSYFFNFIEWSLLLSFVRFDLLVINLKEFIKNG